MKSERRTAFEAKRKERAFLAHYGLAPLGAISVPENRIPPRRARKEAIRIHGAPSSATQNYLQALRNEFARTYPSYANCRCTVTNLAIAANASKLWEPQTTSEMHSTLIAGIEHLKAQG